MRGTQYIYNLCIYLDIEYCPEETYVIPDQTNMNPGIQREPENSGMIVDSHLDSASHYTLGLGALDQQYNTLQYSTVQYSTVQYSTVQYSTVQYSTVQYSTVKYSTTNYNTKQYRTINYSSVQ